MSAFIFGDKLDFFDVANYAGELRSSGQEEVSSQDEISSGSDSEVGALVGEFEHLGSGPSLADLPRGERASATASIAAQKAKVQKAKVQKAPEFDEEAWRKSWDIIKPKVHTKTIDLDEQENTTKIFRLQVQYQGIKDRRTLQMLTESDTTKKYLKEQLKFIKGEADKWKTPKNAVQVARFVQDIDVTLRSLNR